MIKVLRWAGYAFGGLFALLSIAAAALWLISSHELSARVAAKPEHLAQPTPDQLADAERQGRILGCFSCHGAGLRGEKMFSEPMIGTVWAPNLTQVAAHASDEQLARAIRQGIGSDGRSLFIMPSENLQILSDQEVAAIIAMVRRQPPGRSTTPASSYGPIGRLGVVMGKFKTAPALVADYKNLEPRPVGPQYEAGRRLAALYCSGCHNADLSGKEVKPGELSPDLTIAGAYDLAAFTRLLRTGRPAGGQKLPMMGATARSDLSHMTDGQIEQLHAYLVARAQAATP
ncbi:MAG: cytochrome c [Sphingomonas sp.]